MKKIHFALLLIFAIAAGCASQQNSSQSSAGVDYNRLIDEQRYTFVAQTVIPTEDSRFNPRFMFPNGNNLYQLTSGYDLKVTPDSVSAFLPFFGRSFTAPIDPNKGGIKFTSTDFDYKKTIRKKNHQITITPKDDRDVRSVYITVTPSGYASVQILSVNRTPISFNGRIEPNE
ncbi:DUF4251 domain-containing protein [Niabella insulamsoli]|uniref:DUF4251 domain-containing protein n=1 Tax=Niabella insulamsoli TaxID=3144874 RepID=UPI0031FDA91B